jgi:RHH-type transcriptional regulator, rel operon repressor / antitoxin RelB
MARSQPAVTLSVRISPKVRHQLDKLSDATGRTKSFLAAEAIESYIELQAWQVKAISKSVERANSKKAKFVDHNKVIDWLHSWGNKNEKESPE